MGWQGPGEGLKWQASLIKIEESGNASRYFARVGLPSMAARI